MSLHGPLAWCEWLARTPLSLGLRDSRWAFAAIEMVHLAGLAVFGGCLLALALRLAGRWLPRRPLSTVMDGLATPLAGSLTVLAASGAMLFTDGPLRYYANDAFRTKLLLLLIAVALGAATRRLARCSAKSTATPRLVRAASWATLILWLGVGVAGRVVGVL